jgi:hypothetical protein
MERCMFGNLKSRMGIIKYVNPIKKMQKARCLILNNLISLIIGFIKRYDVILAKKCPHM